MSFVLQSQGTKMSLIFLHTTIFISNVGMTLETLILNRQAVKTSRILRSDKILSSTGQDDSLTSIINGKILTNTAQSSCV